MPNDWSFNWESMAMREGTSQEPRCVGSLLVFCVSLLCLMNAHHTRFLVEDMGMVRIHERR